MIIPNIWKKIYNVPNHQPAGQCALFRVAEAAESLFPRCLKPRSRVSVLGQSAFDRSAWAWSGGTGAPDWTRRPAKRAPDCSSWARFHITCSTQRSIGRSCCRSCKRVTLWESNMAENPIWMAVLIRKTLIDGPFSIDMFDYQSEAGRRLRPVPQIYKWLLREEVAQQRKSNSSMNPFLDPPVDLSLHWFMDSSIHEFTDCLVLWFSDLLVHPDSLFHWFIGSSAH